MSSRIIAASAFALVLAGLVAVLQWPAAAQSPLLPMRGEPSAAAVVLAFVDFQSESCAKVGATLEEVRKAVPKDVQVVFKHFPLPEHKDAALAHEAAVEAARQGKFWEMHDLLLANQQKLSRPDLDGYARQLKLDLPAFTKALDQRTHRAVVERDVVEGRALGVSSTPTIYLNGRRAAGLPPAPSIVAAVRSVVTGAEEAVTVPMTSFDFTGSPARGPADAPVTIVEFSDFQCTYCLRSKPTVAQVLERYPGKIRLVFKHFPLEFHKEAPLAHRAALAANEQGKFWEMHDLIFANQARMGRDDLIAHAKTLGLDMPRFLKDFDDSRFIAFIDRDLAEGMKVGVDGTPTFFINGTALVGAQPLDAFTAVIDKALAAPAESQGAPK
jgi:protein-disulfide isomerase